MSDDPLVGERDRRVMDEVDSEITDDPILTPEQQRTQTTAALTIRALREQLREAGRNYEAIKGEKGRLRDTLEAENRRLRDAIGALDAGAVECLLSDRVGGELARIARQKNNVQRDDWEHVNAVYRIIVDLSPSLRALAEISKEAEE